MSVSVTINRAGNGVAIAAGGDELARVQALLEGTNASAPRLIASAVNETVRHLRGGKDGAVNAAKAHLNLPPAKIRQHFSIRQLASAADGGEMVGVLGIDYAANPLRDFKARFARATGVTVTLLKEKGPENFTHMFRATVGAGHTGIFERDTSRPAAAPSKGRYAGKLVTRGPRKGQPVLRQPLSQPTGPSVVGVFEKSPDLADDVCASGAAYLEKRIDSKVGYALERAAAGGNPWAAASAVAGGDGSAAGGDA